MGTLAGNRVIWNTAFPLVCSSNSIPSALRAGHLCRVADSR